MKKNIRALLWQTARFVFVGALNTLIDFIVFNIFAYYIIGLETSWTYFICKSLGFIAAMGNSFFLNSRFTFKDHERRSGTWWRFAAVTITTFAISSAISTEAFTLLRLYTALPAIISGNISVVVSVVVGMCTNFFGYKYFVFHDHQESL